MPVNDRLLIRLLETDNEGRLALDRAGVAALRRALDMAEQSQEDVTLPVQSQSGSWGELTIQHAACV